MADAAAHTKSPASAPPAVPVDFDALLSALETKIAAYHPEHDRRMLVDAFRFGVDHHDGQLRASGEPYFTHPVEVASLLADLRLDDATIITALLHDVIEDTSANRQDVEDRFGPETARLVVGVTKLNEIEEREAFVDSREAAQAENFRKLILAIAEDARVLLVKLADRLHNMRTLGGLRAEKRERIAKETMEVYAPLAGRMGMQWMREELEDLAFRVLVPGARTSVLRRLVQLRRDHGEMVISDVEAEIREALKDVGIDATVEGRQKRPYSIWRKMHRDKIGFESLSDVVGFRVVVAQIEDCYRVLGAIHRKWRIVPGRFKDYISNPKGNGYTSIHTTVIGPNGWRVEIQIRTAQMHEASERGVAAHWSYRDGVRSANPYSIEPTLWLRDVLERLEAGAPPTDFLEHVRLEMYHDQVFCFTPKGDVKRLPRGATALDFAYAVHTALGHSCVGARVDGHQAPTWKALRNGQTVEILRSKGQHPSLEWEDMVVTGKAKSAIRRAVREHHHAELSAFGEQILKRAFNRKGYEMNADDLARALAVLDQPSAEMLYIQIAESEISADSVLEAADPNRAASVEIATKEEPAVFLRGGRHSPVHRYCPICTPIPFERIVGVMDDETAGVLVHRIDCAELADSEDDAGEWLDMLWSDDAGAVARYCSRIALVLANEPGALGAVCTGIGALGANIDNLVIADRQPSFYRVEVTIEVRDARHLFRVLKSLDNQPRVDRVSRISGDSTA